MQIEKITLTKKPMEIYGLRYVLRPLDNFSRWVGTETRNRKKDICRNIFMKLWWNVLQATYSMAIKNSYNNRTYHLKASSFYFVIGCLSILLLYKKPTAHWEWPLSFVMFLLFIMCAEKGRYYTVEPMLFMYGKIRLQC